MMFLVTGKGRAGRVTKVHFTVGEALNQATSLVQRAFEDVRIRDPQGRQYTPDEFARSYRVREH